MQLSSLKKVSRDDFGVELRSVHKRELDELSAVKSSSMVRRLEAQFEQVANEVSVVDEFAAEAH